MALRRIALNDFVIVRTLDLDLIDAEGFTSDVPELRLPHPGMTTRPFVVAPLREVWPEALADAPAPPLHGTWPVGAVAWPRPSA